MAARTEGILEEFPSHALLPKRETQVESFLRKYPEYNGNNVLIAIFDTGVDPGAPGLQVTPSGQRKIVDLIDCTGCGDVDTSTVLSAKEDGTIVGKSGKTLHIPTSWQNPSGKFHVGIKSVYSLYPSKVRQRVQEEKKEEDWDPIQKVKLAEAVANLSQFNIKCPTPTTEAEKLEHENLNSSVEALKLLEKNYKDKGPFCDCIVFHDGEMWRACIDTTQEGCLEECKLLGPYNLTGEHARITKKDMVNYSIHVYEEGNRLSIVTNSGSHGTHVASIAGAYFEDQPELNGLAPGAQLISMQIGDNRLTGMETGTAFIRAMKCAIDNKVDIINMSYGESAKWSQAGRIFDIIRKMVTEHNIIFISSAGNDGPALSTVGAPVSISNEIIGVGAYVSPDMMVGAYSLLEKMGGTQYTWSSNGPCADGKLGVCIVAPGGAITSIPNWTLSKGQLMNGTSMSSPNACGSISVLLSALKSQGIEYSPASIRRCLENTALKIEGMSPFVQGQGMVQIDNAYEYMKEASSDIYLKHVAFKVSCRNASGIYIREDSHRMVPEKHNITVVPKFHKKSDNNLKIEFNKKLAVVSTQSWIMCATHIELNNGPRDFEISIKKSGLRPGCHYGEVQGFDLTYRNLGPLFRLPITVIIPEVTGDSNMINLGNLTYEQGERRRWFYSVPRGATWARLSLKSLDKENKSVCYVVHAVQLLAESANCEYQFYKYLNISHALRPTELVFKVQGGYTMELSIARWWRVSGDSEVSAEMSFHGLSPDHKEITLHGPSAFFRVNVTSQLSTEPICPSASLTNHVIPLSPKESLVRPLTERDLLPDGEQVFSLEATYNFHLTNSCEVTAQVPLLRDVLYESHFESQFWMIYDSNKALCGYGDALNITRQKYFYHLEKGDYVVKLQVRHSDYQLLDRLKDITLNIHITLATSLAVDSYSSRANIFELDKKKMFPAKNLLCASTCPVYLNLPPEDKFPKGMRGGEYLLGKISFTNDDNAKKVCTYPLTVTPAPAKNVSAKKEGEPKPLEEEYQDAHQDFLANWITKLDGLDLQEELLHNRDDSIILKNALLNALDESKNRATHLERIVSAAKEIIAKIDQKEILEYTGMKVDSSDKSCKRKKEIDKQKDILINALYKMSLAVADGILARSKSDECPETSDEQEEDVPATPFLVEDLDQSYQDLLKFVDASDAKMLMVIVRHGMVHLHYGRAIKALMKYFEGNGTTKALYDVLIQLAQSCQWEHVVAYLQNCYLSKFPANYELF